MAVFNNSFLDLGIRKQSNITTMKTLAILTSLFGAFSLSASASSWMQYDQSNSPLPSNAVTATLNDGSITWVGTDEGLAMFNGSDWTIYQAESSTLPGDHIQDIYKDANGNTWVATNNGILKISLNGWEVFDMNNAPIPTDQFRSVTADVQQNLWFGTWGYGLLKYDGANWTVFDDQNSGLPSNGIFDIAFDDSENLWIGTYNGGVTKFDGQNWTTYTTSNSELPHNNVRSVTVGQNGVIWFGTDDGLARKTAVNHWDVFTYLELGHSVHTVHAGIQVEPGHLFFATDGGLLEFEGSTYRTFTAQNSDLPSNNLRCLSSDAEGNLWIGTGNNGVALFSEQDLLSVDRKEQVNYFTPFPNPTTGSITLDLKKDLGNSFEFIVHNNIGQTVFRKQLANYSSGILTLDLNELPNGALSITLVSDRKSDTKRVIKL